MRVLIRFKILPRFARVLILKNFSRFAREILNFSTKIGRNSFSEQQNANIFRAFGAKFLTRCQKSYFPEPPDEIWGLRRKFLL